jgi:hypothetical protein
MAVTIPESEPCPESERELYGDKAIQLGLQLVEATSHAALIQELTRAELAGEISEFHALVLRAIVGMIEERDPDFVSSYLEMAGVVASTDHEVAMVVDMKSTYDSLPMKSQAAASHCLVWVERLG